MSSGIRARVILSLAVSVLLVTLSSPRFAFSQELLEPVTFDANDIDFEDIGDKHLFSILLPSHGFFFAELPESISVRSDSSTSGGEPVKRTALLQGTPTFPVEVGKGAGEIIYIVSYCVVLLSVWIIGFLIYQIYREDDPQARSPMVKVILIILGVWLVCLYWTYSHVYVCFDNASSTRYSVVVDGDPEIELAPFTYSSVFMSTGQHRIEIVEADTGEILESLEVRISYATLGWAKWLIHVVYNIGQFNSYVVTSAYYGPD